MKSLRAAFKLLSNSPWSLGFALGMILFFLPHPDWHGDLYYFRQAADELRHPYYARWLFSLLAWMPEPVAFLFLSLIGTSLLYLAVRVWGGRHWMMFLSFPFAWVIFYGQIDGIVVGGLAVAWWALEKDKPYLIGLGLLLASIKPQLALPLGLAIWWWSQPRWKALVIPSAVLLLSFFQWGFWLPAWLQKLTQTADLLTLSRNVSLWPLTGPWILLIWPVVILLQLPRRRKAIAIVAGTMLSMPYFPLPSSILFLAMAVPWWSWIIIEIPAVLKAFGWFDAEEWLRLLPPVLLIWAAWQGALVIPKIGSLSLIHSKSEKK